MWVKFDPADFLNGVIGLDSQSIGIYIVILMLIYDNGGPIRYDDAAVRKIARRSGARLDHFQKSIKILIDDRKLIVHEGMISNSRAERELRQRATKVATLVRNFGSTVSKRSSSVPKAPSTETRNKEEVHVPEGKTNKINVENHQMGDVFPEIGAVDKNKKENKKENQKEKERPAAKPRPPAAATPARRIDPGRQMSNSNSVFAQSRGLNAKETKFEWDKFVRYYRGISGRNATSPDWDAVWESWVLRAAERLGKDSFVGEQKNGHDHSGPATFTRDDWIKVIEIWRITHNWNQNYGPEPGSRGCHVPPDLVTPS